MSEEEMLHCPYNCAHIILKSRMARHLIKCRQQFPLENFTICPFNTTHDVPVPELKYHMDTCPDRKTMENFLYVMDDEDVDKKEEELKTAEVNLPNLEENWDEEKVPGSYLEVKNKVLEEQPCFRQPVGRSKSGKRAFLYSQMQKFQNINPGCSNMPKPKTSSVEPPKKPISDKSDLKLPDPTPGVVKPKNEEEEEFKLVVRKKTGIGRGINFKDRH